MSQDECVEALEKHASIQPLVTLTVWKELMKENEAFFHAYSHGIHPSYASQY
ncbi:hypothetical protein Scep_021279 [Stephania cephalantha]|uniref:Uncharacterized protein n=1 Tax=Stephania cephalantha TaxID=152367 RepID=A0AAP0F5T1_9MAGN